MHYQTGLGLYLLVLPPILRAYIPTALLRILPLLSTTASLQWAVDESHFETSWMEIGDYPGASVDLTASVWFTIWFRKASWILFGTFPTSVGFGLANVLSMKGDWLSISSPRGLYALGTVFALAHMIPVGKNIHLLNAIREGGEDKTSIRHMRELNSVHMARTLTADLWAFGAFAVGLLMELNRKLPSV